MSAREPKGGVLAYYEAILPFYEKEQEGLSEDRLAFWRDTARRARPRRILDVGAGLGRITGLLSREAPTVGIDLALALLGRAVRRAPAARFAAADARRPCFRQRFDLITASSDPFCHLLTEPDRRAALAAVARQLTDRGLFVLEGLWRRQGAVAPTSRRMRYGGGVLTIEERWSFVAEDTWRARYRYHDRADDGAEREVEASFLARAWDPERVAPLFASCGLSVRERWGGFDRRPFGPESPCLLVAAGPAR